MVNPKKVWVSLLLCSFCALCSNLYAQNATYKKSKLEFRIGGGTTLFFGDLGVPDISSAAQSLFSLDPDFLDYNVNIGAKYNITKWLAIRVDANQGRVHADDAVVNNNFRKRRNLSFYSDIYEASVVGEVVLVNLFHWQQLYRFKTEIYGFSGIGVFHFNPKTKYEGRIYELRSLGTEGQGIIPGTELYSRNSTVIPIGCGIRKFVKNTITIGLELSFRKSFTDYIDDVSGRYYDKNILLEKRGAVASALSDRSKDRTFASGAFRGNPDQNDNYSFIQIYFQKGITSEVVFSEKQAYRRTAAKIHRCPRFN